MPEGQTTIPLFPLETVLFPHAQLQLHIFEDRYRQMVHDCVENGTTFGIVLIRSGSVVGGPAEPYMVGTAVAISELHTYADGQMDIRVVGQERFRIRQLDYSQPFLVGSVEPLHETGLDRTPSSELLVEEAKMGFQTLIQRILAKPEYTVQVQYPPDPTELSFTIANLLQIDNLEKQRLLETTSTEERLERILPVLRNHLDEIEMYQEAYRVAEASKVYRITHEDLRDWVGPN